MSISSSLNASVSGLFAQSSRLATIADNIANSATNGYKRMETEFHSLVINEMGLHGTYDAGGVRTSNHRIVDKNGPLITTDHPLDIAVGGNGMLPIVHMTAMHRPAGDLPLEMVTTGSFRTDENGVLRTNAGQVLLGWPADLDGTFPEPVRDNVSGLEPITINLANSHASPTTEVTLALSLPASATEFDAHGDPIPIMVEYFDNLGTAENLSFEFTPMLGQASGKSNEWSMTIRDSATFDDPSTPADESIIGEYILVFDDTMAAGGTLASVTTVSGGTFDATQGTIPLAVAGGTIDIKLGTPGSGSGITQTGSRLQQAISKNGAPAGTFVGLQIDESGLIKASYDNGFVQTLYKVPLVNVPNINGLTMSNNQTFRVSHSSGQFFLWDAGDGPTGHVIGNALEGSTTDIAAELTHLIQTQRAYSSNAKVIQTVDEMLQETTNIKR